MQPEVGQGSPGTRLDIREALPATLRHRCRLGPGDRVLLAADPEQDLLIVHPPAALDDLLAQRHTEALSGDPA
ncbi:hypothetical protein [Amycolatopsis thermoflava]|uniref:Uncharacterized protein n=1 Tax=Amycolatopsis thermoflava TaxID=84480 RepID=A0A3N2G673_9PSEU|nr:hypothetical protein [Amycolatopsis thermoflava]ROS32146.1 hypothetical protein EDD35_7903 [Amycolatopsis thermoflava]